MRSTYSFLISIVALVASSASGATPVARDGFEPTVPNHFVPAEKPPSGMAWISGGKFSMGSGDPRALPDGGHESMADARPVHRVYVDGFWMDKSDVTNAEFAKFVQQTGYITVAERKPSPDDFPGVPIEKLVPGSAVFQSPEHPVDLRDPSSWWTYVPGANWRHPIGPGSNIAGKGNFPVTQVAYEDAAAYAKWAGKRLPTEAEWEFAARGGLAGKPYVWGDTMHPSGKWMANTFEGSFPNHDSGEDGFTGIAPVGRYAPNAYRLYDMAGNVWQWVSDWYRSDYFAELSKQGIARNPQGPDSSFDPSEPGAKKRVQRGGSFLCSSEYCTRYMVGTRGKGEISSASNHLGFRCVKSLAVSRS